MDSELQNKKLKLIQWLSTLEDESTIEKLVELQKEEKVDWWKSLSETEKKSIEKGIKDANSGKLEPHSKARELYEKWL